MLGTGCNSYRRTVIHRRTFLGTCVGGLTLPAILQARDNRGGGFKNLAGRPIPVLAKGEPIRELL